MSTRTYKNKNDSYSIKTGQESANIPDDFDIPSCTIEDVDRALFDLFENQLPFTYKHKSGTKKAPVIFASGERFAVLRRKEPLRDKTGALILPLISIMRTGITQTPTMGSGTSQSVPIKIKKKLSKKDPEYQRVLNRLGFKNSDDLPSDNSFQDIENSPSKHAAPGRVASRRSIPSRTDTDDLSPALGKNIYEIIEIPPPKYYTATYEVTFWTQYTLQMNDMITALMSLYQSFSQRTFQLETPKGYWFVGYVGEELSPGSNFDDFTDSERIIRYSFNVTVPGYIVNPSYPGSQKTLRKYLSAPEVIFDAVITQKEIRSSAPQGIPSNDPSDYTLEDIRTLEDPLPGQTIGGTNFASSDSRGIFKKRQGAQSTTEAAGESSIGGAYTIDNRTVIVEYERDPFTGKTTEKKLHIKSQTNRKGETVLRESLE